MELIDLITGKKLTEEFKTYETRVKKLPDSYQEVWKKIEIELWNYTDFTGKRLLPIYEDVVTLLEETSSNNISVDKIFDTDIETFCKQITEAHSITSYSSRRDEKRNEKILKKLRGDK